MSTAYDITREIRLKKETTYGVAPGATAAKVLRRVSLTGGLEKGTFQSAEVRTDRQRIDVRHGMRMPALRLDGELSPGSYQDFFENILKRAFGSPATTGAIVTVTAAAGPPGTFTRSAGSFITDGFRVGDVVVWSGWATTGTANNARNYRITALSATVMTVSGLNNEVVAAKAAGDSVTCTVVGRRNFVPTTGHLNESFYLEDWHPGAQFSALYSGAKVSELVISIPPNGLATIQVGLMAQDAAGNSTVYYTSPTAQGTTPITAGPTGAIRIGGSDYGVVTGATLRIRDALGRQDVIGSQVTPDLYPAPSIEVSGELTMVLQDETDWLRFRNETEFALQLKADASSDIAAGFLNFYMPRVKYMERAELGPQNGTIIKTLPFMALRPTSAVSGVEDTTITVQDSGAV